MNSLKKVKTTFHRSQALSKIILNFMEIQLLAIFFIKMSISPYQQIWQVIIINPFVKQSQMFIIYAIFATSLAIIGLFALLNIVTYSSSSCFQKIHLNMIVFFKIFPLVFFVPVSLWNLSQFINSNNIGKMLICLFNLILYSVLIIVYQITNSTNRILQKDYCNLRNTSIITPLLLILTLISFQLTNPIFFCIMLISRSVFKLVQIVRFYQMQLIQRVDLFYGPFFIYLAVMGLLTQLLQSNILKEYVQSTTLILMGVAICYQGIDKNFFYLLNIKLNNSSMLKIVNEVDEQNLFAQNIQKVNQNFQNQARILIGIYLQRLKVKSKQANNYDLIWRYFVRKMVNHKLNCSNVRCQCKTPARSGRQFQNENIMFLKTIMSDFQNNSLTSGLTNLKLLKIYMTLQIQNAPLKAHYELIKLSNTKLGILQQFQADALFEETKQCFDKVFIKEKVQNQNINIKILIEAENKLSEIKTLVEETIELLLNYHEKILESSCSIDDLKARSKVLIQKKAQIFENIIFFIQNYQSKLQQLHSLIFLYQNYLEPYHSEVFQKILDKAELQNRIFKRGDIDVFRPEYGTIQIDLVKSKGKIVNITNNVCKGFGYDKSEMLNKNINNFMPRIFGRCHDKYLKKFVERGRFNILKAKQKIFLARNRKKFIFPIIVRLKVEYDSNETFYATALIKSIKSKSNFIIAEENGKIEEITQGLYKKIFQPLFKEEISRVKNLSIFKMLLSLNYHVKDNDHNDQDRIFQGILLSSQSIETMQKFGMRKDLNLTGTVTQTKDIASNSQNICSASNINSQIQIEELKQKKMSMKERQKYFQDMFIPFLSQINVSNLKGLKIKYRYSIIETSQFNCDLIEILSMQSQTNSKYFLRQTILQLIQIAKLYEIQNKVLDRLDKMKEQYDQYSKTQSMEERIEFVEENKYDQKSDDKFINEEKQGEANIQKQQVSKNQWQGLQMNIIMKKNNRGAVKEILNTQNSESSSLLVNQDNSSSKKQIFKSVFNQTQQSSSYWLLGFDLISIIVLLFVLLFCGAGINLIYFQKALFKNNIYIFTMNQIFQFQSGYQELQKFYINMNLTVPSYIAGQKQYLNGQMNSLIQNLQAEVAYQLSGYIYEGSTINVVNQKTLQPYQIDFFALFRKYQQIYSTKNSNHSFDFFRLNYENLHLKTASIAQQQMLYVEQLSDIYMATIFYIYYTYWAVLLMMVIILVIWEKHTKMQQDEILGMLSYNGMKQIKATIQNLKLIQKIIKNQKQLQGNANKRNNANNQNKEKKTSNLSTSMLISSIKVQTGKALKILKQDLLFINYKLTALLLVIGIFLSNISIVSMFLYQFTDNYLMAADVVALQSTKIIGRPFLLMNVGLSQINRFKQGKQMQVYSSDISGQVVDGFFDFRNFLSGMEYYDTTVVGYGSVTFEEKLFDFTKFSNPLPKYQNISFQYLTSEFRNKFAALLPIIQNNQNLTNSFIQKWMTDNEILQLFSTIETFNQYRIRFAEGLSNMYESTTIQLFVIMWLTGILFTLINIIIILLVRYKIKGYLQNLISNAQKLFSHFSLETLSQNMYIFSYFNQKIKKKNPQKN